jgi:hypothetical protein
MRSHHKVIAVALLGTTLGLSSALDPAAAGEKSRDGDKRKSPVTFKLSVAKARVRPGDLVHFTLEVRNADRPIQLDLKPAKFLNNGLNALVNGELLWRVEGKGSKGKLREPELTSYGGIEPGVVVRDVTVSLKPREVREFSFAAVLERHTDGTLRLLFDDPNSPGLKTFGKRLSRSAWWFPARDGTLTLRLVYDRGGIAASSNDVTLQIEQGEKK